MATSSRKGPDPPTPPTSLVWLVLVTTAVCSGCMIAAGGVLSGPGLIAQWLVQIWVLAWWLEVDSAHQRYELPFDHGFFVLLAWPLYLPYYLLRTRQGRGCLIVLIAVVIYSLAAFVGSAAFLFF